MNDKCGRVNKANPCRCARKAQGFRRRGWLDAENLQFSKDRLDAVAHAAPGQVEELQGMDRQHAKLYRAQPLLAGPDFAARLREILGNSGFAVG
jgi:hypothetical protein